MIDGEFKRTSYGDRECHLNTCFFCQLVPSTGMIRKNSHLRIGRYHQHLHELLDLELSPLDYMMQQFPDVREREEMRKIIGRYGLTGRQQVTLPYANW